MNLFFIFAIMILSIIHGTVGLRIIPYLNLNYNIKIIIKADKVKWINSNTNKITLNDKQVGYIKDYYYKDYKILNY